MSSLILQLALVFVGDHAYKDYHKYNELTRTIEDIFMLPVSEEMLTEKDRVQGKMYSTKRRRDTFLVLQLRRKISVLKSNSLC